MAKPSKIKQPLTVGFAPTVEDMKLIEELKTKYEPTLGPVPVAQMLRMGLRKLAEAEGLR